MKLFIISGPSFDRHLVPVITANKVVWPSSLLSMQSLSESESKPGFG